MKKLVIILLLLSFLLCGCGEKDSNITNEPNAEYTLNTRSSDSPPQIFRSEDFIGKRIGVSTSSAHDRIADDYIDEAKIYYFKSNYEVAEEVKNAKVDAAIFAESYAQKLLLRHTELIILYPAIKDKNYGAIFNKENTELPEKFNNFLRESEANGVLKDMADRWIRTDAPPPMPEIPATDGGGVLRFATVAEDAPFSYMREGKPVGFDVELASRFAAYMGMKLDVSVMSFDAMMSDIQSGKVDFACNMVSITDERAQFFRYSDPYYIDSAVMVVKKTDSESPNTPQVYKAEDFVGKTIGFSTGSTYNVTADKYIGNTEKLFFQSMSEVIEALKNGRIDAAIYAEVTARGLVAQYPDIKFLYPAITQESYSILFRKDDTQLRAKFNEFLKELKEGPVYWDMVSRWFDTVDPPPMPDIPTTGTNGTLIFATAAEDEPFSYMRNGEYAGFDVELAARFAAYMNMELDVSLMSFDALFPTVQSGRADFAGNMISVSDERALSFSFSEPYYSGGTVMLVYAGQENKAGQFSLWENVKKSFYQNLVVESRWKLVLDGLRVTIVISFFAMLLGTLLGFLLCYMALSRFRLLNTISKTYTALLRGTPIVVLLMIIFYIIFARVHINPVLVAIIAFGLNSGAFIGEIVRSAISTVDKGQVEAARSMGFSSIGAFLLVTMPQATRIALPVYKSEFVSLVKATAVVGYIAIIDLTKAGDIIRSRTYDAFLPLLAVAAVYLLTTSAFLWLFGLAEKLADKRGRRKKA